MTQENLVALYYYTGGKTGMKQVLDAYEKLAKEMNFPTYTVSALKGLVNAGITHYEERISELPNGKEISEAFDKMMKEDSIINSEEV